MKVGRFIKGHCISAKVIVLSVSIVLLLIFILSNYVATQMAIARKYGTETTAIITEAYQKSSGKGSMVIFHLDYTYIDFKGNEKIDRHPASFLKYSEAAAYVGKTIRIKMHSNGYSVVLDYDNSGGD